MALDADAHRSTFSREQLARYASKIYESPPERGEALLRELEERIQRDPLGALTNMQQRHLAAIPFGNVVLHYSQHHTISLDPDYLFHKLVERGMGGYCVESTGLFAIVLRSLGFKMYTGAAKVSQDFGRATSTGLFVGWSHMVIFVTIGTDKYMVDVGFGPNCPTRPLLMEEGRISPSVGPNETRLIRGASAAAESDQKQWIYQFRANAEDAWKPGYLFSELEFLREDYEIMNFWTSQNRRSHFTRGFLVSRFLLNETKDDIVGCVMLLKNVIKQNSNGEVQVLLTLKTDEERVDALARLFSIHLLPMEIRGIRSLVSELVTGMDT
ncbi:hypothetical protein VTO42DRAFT_2499 [Malbranchea cinnamomea]